MKRASNTFRLYATHLRRGGRLDDTGSSCPGAACQLGVVYRACSSVGRAEQQSSNGGGRATPTGAGRLGAWLLVFAAASPSTVSADTPPNKASGEAAPSFASSAQAAPSAGGAGHAGDGAPAALTNHPLEYDPVTNEHTAKMTMARTAALEYYNAGKYAQAEAKFREAVAEAQLGFEAGDPHIASTKNNLAEFLRNTGRWDEAEKLYKEALDLLESNFGEKHWLFVSALHNLALSYEARGDLAAARATMERVLALRLSMFGPRHFLYADSLFALGHMLRAVRGQAAAALRMMDEAVRVLEEAEKVQVNVVLYWLTEIANCHTADSRPDQAAAVLRRAVAHMATERGDDSAYASALNEQLVDALEAAGKPGEAAKGAAAALAARRKLFGEAALVVAQTEFRLAQLLSALAAKQQSEPKGSPGESAPAERALQHAEAAARLSASNVEECSRRSFMSGPPPDKLLKRLRAAHTLGSAAKLVTSLSGVADPAATAAAAASQDKEKPAAARTQTTAPAPAPSSSSWWPFGQKAAPAKNQEAAPAKNQEQQGQQESSKYAAAGSAAAGTPIPVVPGADLAAADRYLEQAVAALTAAVAAGKELMQDVSSGRRQLPKGATADELASLLVEAQLQLLDVLERLGLVLQARVAAGHNAPVAGVGPGGSSGGDMVARHRRILEQQERVAAELLG